MRLPGTIRLYDIFISCSLSFSDQAYSLSVYIMFLTKALKFHRFFLCARLVCDTNCSNMFRYFDLPLPRLEA